MRKKGIFHPQLCRVLAELRHMDMLVVGDAGLPIPTGVERVDLGWIAGDPKYLDVLKALMDEIVVEKAIFANEALTVSPDFHKQALALLPENLPTEYVPHTQLKKISEGAKAIILTGEFTGYTNVVLVCGCAY